LIKKKYFWPVFEVPLTLEEEYLEKLNFLFGDEYDFMKQLFEMGFKDFDFNSSKLS
jgi:hypothetical protein